MSFRGLRKWRLSRWRKLRRVLTKATPQIRAPAYIGAAVFGVIGLLAVLGIANTQQLFYMPQSLGEQAVSYAVWGMKPSNLLMALPIGAFLVVLARSFVGMKAFGLFTPMLIAIAFLQIGPIFGPLVLISAVGVGMLAAPTLLKLRMTRVGFLGVLISFVVFVLAGLQVAFDTELQVDAFPVVVTALVVERWYRQWEKDGAKEAFHIAMSTFLLALIIQFVMVSRVALTLIEISPLVLPGFAGLAIALLGRYRGLRLSELKRFAPIWLEGIRNAKAAATLDQRAEAALDIEGNSDTGILPQFDLPVLPQPRFGGGWDAGPRPALANSPGRAHRRDTRDQSAQFDYREIQSALGNRTGARQSGGESGPERWRRRNYRHGMRNLQLWGSA
ncbi:7TM domain-containing protein [Aurantiacibacter marinus]|uniref:7TM domain-containing protein n=1 Tax=Aurantiacibacter marinus TaxID=874156 RepID=UPI000B051BA6|nr:7TM domain-containing protein [Aurantiacibacter marinus]